MAKLMLMKKPEISVPEDKKGKQIAVKESNIISLKDFYRNNYQIPSEPIKVSEPEVSMDANIMPSPTIESNPVNEFTPSFQDPILPNNNFLNDTEMGNNIIEEKPILNQNVFESNDPIIMDSPIIDSTSKNETPIVDTPINLDTISTMSNEEDDGTNDSREIKLTIENNASSDMDPELQEIKDRLDKVIMDLNNYKKKIKMLEDEVNQNLEKSKEVLKDTQAAARIMSIQQERQKEIMNEMNSKENDTIRALEKEAA